MIFNEHEIREIKSMGVYWEEVSRRENSRDILLEEFRRLYQAYGLKLMWAILDYVKNDSKKE